MFHTFVINLDKDTLRMQFMHEQLTSLGISYERQPAILGKSFTPTPAQYVESKAVAATGHALLPGELGCALSHAAVYKKIVAEQLPFTLVFEDDVELPGDFQRTVLRMIAEQTKTGFEYLLFDYVPVGVPFIHQWFRSVRVHVKSKWQKSIWQGLAAGIYALLKVGYIVPLSLYEGWRDGYHGRHGGAPVRFLRPVYFAGAYLLTLEGAKKLLALAEPIVYTADQLPNRARVHQGLRFFCYAPLSVRQLKATFGSSILDLAGKDIECDYE